MSLELKVDPERAGLYIETGIPVRAIEGTTWVNVDIVFLDRRSLLRWLHSRGQCNRWAEQTVLAMLNHEPVVEGDAHHESPPFVPPYVGPVPESGPVGFGGTRPQV